ncbi:MAG: nucleoside hydrolase [Clostridiales bacterium]|nr:nucleoside hydrolase [Clostridiales bacterium]
METIKKKKVICDCDNTASFPGRPMDDALAILYLLGCREDIELLGITSNYGNGTSAESYFSSTTMLSETGYTGIPVFNGAEQGEDPICDSSRFIAEMADKYPGELIYLGIGSLGNLYGAYLIDNDIFDKIGQIVLMGGITEPLFVHGGTPLDELNFSVNPVASAVVLSKGHNISIITGNNCLPVSELPKNEFLDKLCGAENPAGMYIAQKCGYRFRTKEVVYGADSSYCWDVVAAAFINHPEKYISHPTPCFINEKDIAGSGFLHPCSEEEANNIINIPEARSRIELQEIFYSSWLSLSMSTSDANFSCKGLYLDKLIQPCILIELSQEPCYGLKLLQKLKDDGYTDNSLDPAGFYRNLRKMEKDGYLTSKAEGKGPKARKIFTITDFGRRALINWEESLRKYERHINRIVYGINSLDQK